MKKARMIAAVCGGLALMGLAACQSDGDQAAGVDAVASDQMTIPAVDTVMGTARAEVGSMAPDFTLVDLDGKAHTLSSYTSKGKVVVLEWFNPQCPFVVKHYRDAQNQTMNELAKSYAGDDVVWLRINSGAPGKQGHGMDLNKQTKKDWKMKGAILVDETGTIGRAYGARTTPHMYIVNTDGMLVYNGAIDNNSSASRPGETNYVDQALRDIMAGRDVRVSETSPYGCSVKYGA